MTFNPLDEPIDHILLANLRSPGIAVIANADSMRRWDERRGYALSGARVVFRGIGLAKPIVTIRLFTTSDWNDWHQWREDVGLQLPPRGERARAKDIWHPILEDLGIVSVVIQNVLQPKQVADGEWNIDIKMIEFRVPIRTLETIGSSEERQLTEAEQLILDLESQRDVLSAELEAIP